MGSNMVMQTDTSHVDTRGDHTSVTALEITTSTSGQVSEAWVLWEGQSREEGGALGFGGPGPTLRGWYLRCCGGRAGRLWGQGGPSLGQGRSWLLRVRTGAWAEGQLTRLRYQQASSLRTG